MTILAVDNFEKRLMNLVDTLRTFYPNDEIMHFTDPLYALKHIFTNNVDIVYAEAEMGPINGETLSKVVREQYKHTVVYCLTDSENESNKIIAKVT